MTVSYGYPLLPDVWEDEGGDKFFAAGHVDKAAFALQVGKDLAVNCDATEAANVVLVDPEAFLARVKHCWWRPVPGSTNDEAMERCGQGDEGAVAITEVIL